MIQPLAPDSRSLFSLAIFKQLYRLMTLLDISFIWWLFIAFFWVLGFASTPFLYIGILFMLGYYYLSLLPIINQLLSSSYGQLLFSKKQLKYLPLLLATTLTLLTLPGLVHFYQLAYTEAFFIGFCLHLILHAFWLNASTQLKKTGQVAIFWLLISQHIWAKPLFRLVSNTVWSEFVKVGLVMFAVIAVGIITRRVQRRKQPISSPDQQQSSFYWRSVPRHQTTLGACYLFQHNAKAEIRFLVYCAACALLPAVQTLMFFWLNAEWRWFPELGWKLLDDTIFVIPFIYWLNLLERSLGQVKSAWLLLPQSRSEVFGFLERYFLSQLILFSMPLLLLLYCWQPQNPTYFSSALLLICLLLTLTYLVLCAPKSSIAVFIIMVLLISFPPEMVFLASLTSQFFMIGNLGLLAIVLRYFALKGWRKRDYTKAATFIRQRHV